MKRIVVTILICTLLLGIGFYAFNNYIYNEKQEGAPVQAYRGTLTGEYVCLPHKNREGPQTLECAFGMKTDSGEHYVLDFGTMSQEYSDMQVGERFKANGTITPIELLSSDHWQIYDVVGIFSVTDSVEKL